MRKVFHIDSAKIVLTADGVGLENEQKNLALKPAADKQSSMVFLKTHKSGSTTLIAPFQKYAYMNNLLVMVPNQGLTMLDWPLEFSPNIVNIPAKENEKFDMLLNHVIFNKSSIAPLMKPNTKYFTVLREPLAHLKSSFKYFGIDIHHVLGIGKAGFEKFLSDPYRYDIMPPWIQVVVPLADNRVNSLTQNLQSADLGLMRRDFFNNTKVDQFIAKTMSDFDLILILERIHESLILFRRMMGWEMKDVMFIAKNGNPSEFTIPDLSEDAKTRGRWWCSVDQALYLAANQKLSKLADKEKDLHLEINVFKKVQKSITEFCHRFATNHSKGISDTLTIPQSAWNSEFRVDHTYCVLLLLDERDMTLLFKCKQAPDHPECRSDVQRVHSLTAMLEGDQLYRFLAFTTRPPVNH